MSEELNQATFKATILQAQLGGWEAQCAAQVTAAQIYLDVMATISHDGPQIAARGRLANAIDSNAGQLLIQKLESQQADLERTRHAYASAEAARAMAAERIGYLERMLELLRNAATPAAALLREFDETGSMLPESVAAARTPLDAVLAAGKAGTDGL